MLKKIFLFSFLWLGTGCSISVPGANAPTNPPSLTVDKFNVVDLRGQYQQSDNPKMFLWPTDKVLEDGQIVPLSLSEQALVRKEIIGLSEDVETFSDQMNEQESQLQAVYGVPTQKLENQFTSQKCYSYCDDFAFSCTPDDPTILEIDDDEWKVPEDEAEEKAILACQANQAERKSIRKKWKAEIAEKVTPIQEKAGDAALGLLQAVGDRNYFTDLTEFKFSYEMVGINNLGKLSVSMKYGDIVFSTEPDAEFKISQVVLDEVDGYLDFKAPLVDLENKNQIVGEIEFQLEFTVLPTQIKIGGDIRQIKDGEVKVGRFASAGQLEPIN